MARRHHIVVGSGGWLLLLGVVGFVVYWLFKNKGTTLTTTQGTMIGPPAVWGTDPLTGDVTLNGQIYSPSDLQASNIVPSQHPASPNSINSTNPSPTGSVVPLTLVPNWSRAYPQA